MCLVSSATYVNERAGLRYWEKSQHQRGGNLMEGQKGRGKHTLNHEDDSGKASRSQQKEMWEARMFKLKIPKEVQQRINETEKQLWEELDIDRLHEAC